MYQPHTHCRACGLGKPGAQGIKANATNSLIPVFDLGIQPLANDFCGPYEERAGYAPLKVLLCPRCKLAQLSVVVRPEILYAKYSYVTSNSDTMVKHFDALDKVIREETDGRRLLEIGSNDGRMLAFFQSRNMVVCGIDPADNLAAVARSQGLRTITGLFDPHTASIAAAEGLPDVVLARHVFCHVDDWKAFINCLSLVSHPETVIGIEVPHAHDMLERGEFDTIYHEHTSYLSIRSMQALLEDSPFRMFRVEHFPIHGGAILLLLRRKDSNNVGCSIEHHLESEQVDESAWKSFSLRARENISSLKEFVSTQRANGKSVCGFGASAKSTVWVNACGFSRKDLLFITDTTLHKQWKLSPGTDIPIVDEGAILRELPDYAVCFAWNFRNEILEKNALARSKGVKFVFPIPELEIV